MSITKNKWKPTFIEMFSGIGGFRLGLERVGWKCVWANDRDKYANTIYKKNFGDKELVEGDITEVEADEIPEHTLLTAGFPCQAFSVAGKRKGFQDTRGTLFFHIARVAKAKRPPLLLLENVKGLLSTQDGYCFARIIQTLDELGYDVEWQVLNSKHFGVPQNRERVFIIGHLRGKGGQQIFPIGETDEVDKKVAVETKIKRVIGSGREMARVYSPEGVAPTIRVPSGGWHQPRSGGKDSLDRHTWDVIVIADRSRNYAGKGRNLESPKKVTNALSSVQKDNLLALFDGHPNGRPRSTLRSGRVPEVGLLEGLRIRRLTPMECERLQGFPDGWTEGVSDTQRYKLLGNAVTVNVVEYLGKVLLEAYKANLKEMGRGKKE